MRVFFFAITALFAGLARAQTPPDTDIYMMALPPAGTTETVDTLTNLTQRPGYDNQPAFTLDGTGLLYTSIRDGQTDIYRVNLATGTHEQVTFTPSSEYSPTPTPDGNGFSVVKVDADGAQRLWRYSLDGLASTVVFDAIDRIGYQAWGAATTLGLFLLGEPPVLVRADTKTQQVDTLATDVGRSLQPVPARRALSFVQREAPDHWAVMQVNLDTGAVTRLADARPGQQDHAWTPDGRLLMAEVDRLFEQVEGQWKLLADLAGAGVTNVTRLAVSPDGRRLALVAEPAPR